MKEFIVSYSYVGSDVAHIKSFRTEKELKKWRDSQKKKIEINTIVEKSSL